MDPKAKQIKVSIKEARIMSQEGVWVDNPDYDPISRFSTPKYTMKKFFRARWIILWRPDSALTEKNQYCMAEEIL